jgi:cellulose synthase/poly-beta-1,6-N-acetylglucosamine synthase-like glycosyltransferase
LREFNYSVVVTCYNSGTLALRAIQSVIDQTLYKCQEIIVVDDCSTHDVPMTLNNPLVTYFRTPKNLGSGGAKNFGLSQVKTDFVAFLDSDDYWLSNFSPTQWEVWQDSDSNLACVGLSMKLSTATGSLSFLWDYIKQSKNKAPITLATLWQGNPMTSSAAMFKTSILKSVGGYCTDSPVDDYETFVRLLSNGFSIRKCHEVAGIYTISMGQITGNPSRQLEGQLRVIKRLAMTLDKSQSATHRKYLMLWFMSLARCANYELEYEKIPRIPINKLYLIVARKVFLTPRTWPLISATWRCFVRLRHSFFVLGKKLLK